MNAQNEGIEVSEIDGNTISVILSKEIYEKEAVFASLYLFEDRCFMKMSPEGDSHFRVGFSAKDGHDLTEEYISNLMGEFCNELIDQQVRRELEKKFGTLRNLIVEHAFSPIKNLERRVS